uniref:CD63 antigen n=1 Tax=Schistocephalus solidus TaxID=70667 RepID=A0A183SAE0_SCHSO
LSVMAVSGCANCLRVLTIIFNFVVFFATIIGILLVVQVIVAIVGFVYKDEGCAQLAEDYIKGHSTTLFIVAIVVALLQLAAVIVACCLQSSIRKYQTV